MKLLRWAAAGASAYVVYRYSVGSKARGEDVFKSPERDLAVDMPEPDPAATKRPAGSVKP